MRVTKLVRRFLAMSPQERIENVRRARENLLVSRAKKAKIDKRQQRLF